MKKRLLFSLLFSSIACMTVQAQGSLTATWALSASTTTTASVTGAGASSVTASNMVHGSTFSSNAFNTDGYKCTSPVTWPTVATSGYNLDFPLSPKTGFNLTVTSLTFTIKISGSSGAMKVSLAWSLDGGAFTTAGTVTTGTSNAVYNLALNSLNITASSGHSLVLRAYVFAAGSTTSTSRNVFIKNVAFTGSTGGGGGTTPTLSVSPTTLSFGSAVVNTVSPNQSYALSGSNLTPASGSISVTAPSGFEISTSSGSGFGSTLSVSYTSSTLGSTTIFTRFHPTAVQGYGGNISNSGGGASSKTVAVSGTGVQNVSTTAIYVSPSGNDANNGSFSSPFKTIPKAVSVAVAGDTIFVRGGVHTYSTSISISVSGSASARFYLLAFPGERPLLEFGSMAVSSSNRGMNLSGSFWTIKGIDFHKAGDNGMFVSGSNDIIEFCSFIENSDTGLQLGGGASNDQIINCDSYFNADPSNGNADGFAAKLDIGTNISFVGCRSWQNSDDGWDGYLRPSDNVTWSMDNCWCFRNGYLKNGSASSGNGNGFKTGGSDNADLRHDVTLTRCLSAYNRVKGYDQNHNKGNITLYNCTAFNNGTNYSFTEALASGKALTLKNCISAGSGAVSLGTFAVLATNSWMSPFTVTNADFVSVDSTGLSGPRKADGSLPDINFMHLAAGSDLINAGTNVGLPFNGSAPDLGCFETNVSSRLIVSAPVLADPKTTLTTFPNPAGNSAMVRFSVAYTGPSVVNIYNTNGQLVSVLFRGTANAGTVYSLPLQVGTLAPGVYISRLENNGKIITGKITVAR